jgi:quinol monooxygenase YgiN
VAEEFIIVGWLDYAANRDQVLAHFVEVARLSRAEPGCLDYWVTADPEHTGRIRVFERWVSEDDLAEHFRTPHIADFRSAIESYPRSGRDLHRYFVSRGEEFQSSRPPA